MKPLNFLLKSIFSLHTRYLKKHGQSSQTQHLHDDSVTGLSPVSWQELSWHEEQSAHYSSLFRGGVLVSYFLGFMAVVFAVIPISGLLSEENVHHFGFIFVLLELMSILLIITIYLSGTKKNHGTPGRVFFQNWRGQWQEQRTRCEILRYKEMIGWIRPKGISNKYAIPEGVLFTSPPSSEQMMSDLLQQVKGQLVYNKKRIAENHFIKHKLHNIAKYSFILTLLCCLGHFVIHSALLSALSAILPALGSCCHGIVSTAEYEKIGQQCQLTALELEALQNHRNQHHDALLLDEAQLRAQIEAFLKVVLDDRDKWYLFTSSSSLPLG